MNIMTCDWSDYLLCDSCYYSFSLNTFIGNPFGWKRLRLASISVLSNLDIAELLYVLVSLFFPILSPGLNYVGREFLILL